MEDVLVILKIEFVPLFVSVRTAAIQMPVKPKKERILNQRILMERMTKQSLTQILIWSKRRMGEETHELTDRQCWLNGYVMTPRLHRVDYKKFQLLCFFKFVINSVKSTLYALCLPECRSI